MKPELDNQSVHRYMRVYNYYKQLILSQQLAPGSRLPSIRRCAAELQKCSCFVSRMSWIN